MLDKAINEMFAIKNCMIDIPANFSSKSEFKCQCGKREDMVHIYKCELYNCEKQPRIQFEKIYNGNLKEQIEVYNKFKQNMNIRAKIGETSSPCDLV